MKSSIRIKGVDEWTDRHIAISDYFIPYDDTHTHARMHVRTHTHRPTHIHTQS